MPEYKLSYYPLRSRCEPIRVLLAYTGCKYNNNLVSNDQWMQIKDKTPFGQMPVMEVDGKQLAQTTAILRYFAREHGLTGKNSMDMALADMYVEGIYEMWGVLHPVYMPLITGDQQKFKEEVAKFKANSLGPFLDRYSKFLATNKSGWFVGDSITWADLVISEFLSVLQDCFLPEALAGHSDLKHYVDKVHNLPQLKEYIKNRPKTIF